MTRLAIDGVNTFPMIELTLVDLKYGVDVIGEVNYFIVLRDNSSGFYLRKLNSTVEVFMPPAMAPADIEVNQRIQAFVYLDPKGNVVATSRIPDAVVGEYSLLKVVDVQDFGAFFDWGIEKDLLVPGNEQKVKVKEGESHLVRVCLEEKTNRIYGTTKLGKYIKESRFDFSEQNQVEIIPVQKMELGYRVIINKKNIGMIYDNEIFSSVEIGKSYTGIVKKRRSDGLLDASLQSQGVKNLVDSKEVIIEMLKNNGGKSSLNDKSSPQLIREKLGMSKKTFKNAIGMLYKERKILISKDGISLTQGNV